VLVAFSQASILNLDAIMVVLKILTYYIQMCGEWLERGYQFGLGSKGCGCESELVQGTTISTGFSPLGTLHDLAYVTWASASLFLLQNLRKPTWTYMSARERPSIHKKLKESQKVNFWSSGPLWEMPNFMMLAMSLVPLPHYFFFKMCKTWTYYLWETY